MAFRFAMRFLGRRSLREQAKLEALRRDIRIGLDQLDRGQSSPGDKVIERLRARRRRESVR